MLRARWTGRLVPIAALSALLLAGCAGKANEPDDEARSAATLFLDELRAGRLEPAWQGTSSEFKSMMGLENLRDLVKRQPALRAPADFTEIRPIDRNGLAMAECLFQARPPLRGKPAPATIRVLLATVDEGWKVEQLTVE